MNSRAVTQSVVCYPHLVNLTTGVVAAGSAWHGAQAGVLDVMSPMMVAGALIAAEVARARTAESIRLGNKSERFFQIFALQERWPSSPTKTGGIQTLGLATPISYENRPLETALRHAAERVVVSPNSVGVTSGAGAVLFAAVGANVDLTAVAVPVISAVVGLASETAQRKVIAQVLAFEKVEGLLARMRAGAAEA